MLDVIIALTPALIAATVIFGGRALLLTAVCVASCVVFEWLMCLLLKKDNTIGDLSAIVTLSLIHIYLARLAGQAAAEIRQGGQGGANQGADVFRLPHAAGCLWSRR